MQRTVELDLISVAGKSHVLQGRVCAPNGIEEVIDLSHVGANNACFDIKDKRLGIVEGWIDIVVSTDHLPAEPTNVNPEVLALSQHQIVRINVRGDRVGGTTCGSRGG